MRAHRSHILLGISSSAFDQLGAKEEAERGRMKGSLSHELEVGVPAGDVWEVYGTIRLAELAAELVPNVVAKFDVEQGDGGLGTILLITFPSGAPGPQFHKEKFVKIDNEKRAKDIEVIEGGYLELGFSSFSIRFEIVEKGDDSSIIRTIIEYEIKEELAANASLVTTAPFEAIAEAVAKYLKEKKAT